jgi:hypothetical protein
MLPADEDSEMGGDGGNGVRSGGSNGAAMGMGCGREIRLEIAGRRELDMACGYSGTNRDWSAER